MKHIFEMRMKDQIDQIFDLFERLGSAFDELDPRLSLLCQVGDDVIRPCKICGGCQIRVPRSIHSINVVPYNLDSNLYKEYVLSTSNATSVTDG